MPHRLLLCIAVLAVSLLALTGIAVHAVASAVWYAIHPATRAALLQLNWAMLGTFAVLLILCPAILAMGDRNR